MKKVKALQDDSSHWYIIPNELANDFNKEACNEDFCNSGRFDEKYGKYRAGGSINLIQLYAEI